MRFNNLLALLLAATMLAALPGCNTNGAGNKTSADSVAATSVKAPADSVSRSSGDIDTSDNATLYFTVADTGLNYYTLAAEMYALHQSLRWTIDTMDRYYNKKLDQIVVSDTDEDEMYRGEYEPRRFPSASLSLEYYHTYADSSTVKNIALVAGIFENRKSADSSLAILKPHASKAFVMKAQVYLGCIH